MWFERGSLGPTPFALANESIWPRFPTILLKYTELIDLSECSEHPCADMAQIAKAGGNTVAPLREKKRQKANTILVVHNQLFTNFRTPKKYT